jgi:hypothetical protein
MKTLSYNPSPLEVEIARILQDFTSEIGSRLLNRKIVSTAVNLAVNLELDNPTLHYEIADADGDRHVITIKIIQKPDLE